MSLKANLIAYWKLNDDADNPTIKDAVGENDGDYKDSGGYIDTSTGSVSGKVGKAIYFDGSDEYSNHGKDESLLAIKKGWNKYSANPVLSTAGDGFTSVFKDGNDYYAWSGSSTTIYRHTSSDDKSWGSRTACTGLTNASIPSVWKEGATWHMMYRGPGSGAYTAVRYATSADGLVWTDQGIKISQGGVGEWDYDKHLDPWGIIKIGSTYYLWYNTVGGGVRKLGLAFATDLSGSWTKDSNNPIFSGGRFCAWCFKYGDYYYLAVPHYTSGSTPDDHAEIELYRDSNPTFYSADREFVRILATVARETTWDDDELDTPCILTDTIRRNSYAASNDELWMYYAGKTGATWKTGMIIETNPSSVLIKRGLTVAFWMKHGLGLARRIMAWGATGNKYGWCIQNRAPGGYGSGNLSFGSSQGHIETRLSAENDFNDNEWHFVVCTWDGIDESTAKIFVDNVEQTTYLIGTFVIGISNEPLVLGCRFSSGIPGYFLNGTLDNVMIFDKALSPDEISYLWDNGDGRESITAQYPYFVYSEVNFLGDYKEDSIIHFSWHTQDSSGSSVTRDPVGTIKVYKDDNTAESTAGITDVKDFGGITGVHNCKIDLSADAFYESGHDYSIVLDCPVLDDESVKVVLASFSIQNRFSASLQKAAKVIVNKAIQNKSTGKIDYYDDDGQTVILTHTPTDGESEIERTPS